MNKNTIQIEIEECPLKIETTRNGIKTRQYIAIPTSDKKGIYLNGPDDVPERILKKMK